MFMINDMSQRQEMNTHCGSFLLPVDFDTFESFSRDDFRLLLVDNGPLRNDLWTLAVLQIILSSELLEYLRLMIRWSSDLETGVLLRLEWCI